MDERSYICFLEGILRASRRRYTSNGGTKYIGRNLSEKQLSYVETLIDNAEAQKSLIAVTITSLLKKTVEPSQNIRLHRSEFKGGYSGRTLDTKIVTPWLKKHFSRFAPKESGWLTRSIEQPHPFNRDFPGRIRNRNVKNAFLFILEDVEQNKTDPESYLTCIVIKLLKKTAGEQDMLSDVFHGSAAPVTIDIIINMLEEQFSMKQASRLPVVAVYTIYQILLENVKIYRDKTLLPLKPHTVSDRRMGYGDIEIYDGKDPFEIVEVKHNVPIDETMLSDVLVKIKGTTIKRYFILTTASRNFKGSKKNILGIVHKVKARYNKDLIPNGIIPSLKYYLRFVPDLEEFLAKYTKNLIGEFAQSSDIKEFHIEGWQGITRRYNVQTENLK